MPTNSGRATIVDVARAAGTSVSSASVALRGASGVSEPTRERILEAARRLGFRADRQASLLRRQQPRVLGVTFALDQPFHTDVVDNLYRAADGCEHDLVLSAATATRSETDAAESLLRDRARTLLLISPALSERQLAELTTRASVVTIGSQLRAGRADSVRADDQQGITDAVEHLVSLGHRDIAYADGGDCAMSAVRRAAYAEAMRTRGLEPRVIGGAPTEESGIGIADHLLAQGGPPTAVLAHNDMIALGLLLTLRSRGIAVPGEVSVVGYDDTRTAALATLRLTSVSQDAARLARTAVELATTEGEEPSGQDVVVPTRLVVRDTTGPPRE